ncbi:restriction endonuclease subunit S [Methylocaldum sp. RMAD-M]|uniref:restriction endonuclease subunit S n=1 Tax=Methylocaldum sp. RMAD-M TaxID=2806557 RepID=UPI000A321668|nr:restriction endonuclease subunit S [Methylocaldum sp. RMAD-M]MBP1152709.1 type I restriction enzyme S subunit [Methylocaldum sp. RMAD-M]
MTYAEYRDLKNSGIKWLQDIPSHWRIKRLKFSTELVNDKVSVEESSLPYLGLEHIESWTGRRIFGEIANSEGLASAFSTGDLLFGKLRPYLAKVHLAEQEGLISSEALVIRSKAEVHSAFLKYYMLSRDFINIVDSSTYGSKMPRANWDFIGNLPLLLPELEEQQAIARFLDFKTAQIDALIAKKQALLDKLAEKRTALISHAVTKGLDPLVPMKDSGVAWLGEIPAHWEVKRLKFVSPFITVGIVVEPSKYYVESGIPALRSLNVKQHQLITDDLVFISPESNDLHAKSKIFEGDLVAVRSGQPGTTAIVDKRFHGANCIDLIIIRKPTVATSEFLDFFLNSKPAKAQFESGSGGAIQQHFNITTAGNLIISCPSIKEQTAITTFLDRETAEIDALATKIEQAISRLQEYHAALITNAVTGKIDVRAWQPNQEAA